MISFSNNWLRGLKTQPDAISTEASGSVLRWVIAFWGLALAALTLSHPETIRSWWQREDLPDLPLWLLVLIPAQLIIRRACWPSLRAPYSLCIVGLLVAIALGALLPSSFALVALVTAGLVYSLCLAGTRGLVAAAPTSILLLCCQPMPPMVIQFVVVALCDTQALLAAALVPLFAGQGVIFEQHSIFLADEPSRALCVIEPSCSGLRSMAGLLLLTLFIAGDPRITHARRFTVVLIAIPIALAGNGVRIVAGASFLAHGTDTLAVGPGHQALGFVVLFASIGILLFTAGYLREHAVQPDRIRKPNRRSSHGT